jgi:hypothetical protein
MTRARPAAPCHASAARARAGRGARIYGAAAWRVRQARGYKTRPRRGGPREGLPCGAPGALPRARVAAPKALARLEPRTRSPSTGL